MSVKTEGQRFSLPLLGVLLTLVFWLLDALLDIYLFRESDNFIDSLLFPDAMELWMRLVISVLIISFAFYASRQLQEQKDISRQLTASNNRLSEEIVERIKTEELLEQHVNFDMLTGLLSRRKFDDILDYEVERERRYQGGLTFIFCDIDNFKKINDGYGHKVGDDVLRLFAEKLKASVRETDIVARWGGEEFCLLLLNTVSDQTERMADSIREKIECIEFEQIGKVTVSMGVTHFIESDTKRSLFMRADKALHLAKENGRNRVEVAIS